MMRTRSICFRGVGCMVLAFLAFSFVGPAGVAAEPAETNADKLEKVTGGEGVARAALAIQLAMEGQEQKSPILMLAAAELLGGLQASQRELQAVAVKEPAAEADADAPLAVDMQAWLRQARQYSQGNKALEALLEETSRGLVWHQGHNLPNAEVQGHAFKVLTTDDLNPGQSLRLQNVIFEGEKPAVILVIGDGNGDLDLWVYCGNTNGEIGKDVDATSRCVVQWMTKYEGPFNILIRNVGRGREKFVVLANW